MFKVPVMNSHKTTLFKGVLSLKIHFFIYLSVLHSHRGLMKLCPCGIYRQLNSIPSPSNHILKSSKIIFNVSVIKEF